MEAAGNAPIALRPAAIQGWSGACQFCDRSGEGFCLRLRQSRTGFPASPAGLCRHPSPISADEAQNVQGADAERRYARVGWRLKRCSPRAGIPGGRMCRVDDGALNQETGTKR